MEDLEDPELNLDDLELDLGDPDGDEEDRRQDHLRDQDDPRDGTPTRTERGKEHTA